MKATGFYMAPNWTLRSGGANGADKAFEAGARRGGGKMEIWNPRTSRVHIAEWAKEEIRKHCWEAPYDRMKDFTQQLLGRNMYQILGANGDQPVDMVILWTPQVDPCLASCGGTRYAARCARAHDIPIHNLRDPKTLAAYQRRLKELQ